MLDTLPTDVWSNKDLKWLDPAVGIGNFPAAILNRLMKGLKEVIQDEDERRKHILENMLFMSDISTKNLFLLYQLFDDNQEFKLNVFRGDFLSDKFDEHMKEVWGLDGFDLVVGNPPYQDSNSDSDASKLYIDFTKKSIKLFDNFILFVTPETLIRDGKNKFNIKNEKGLCYINHKSNNFFNVGVTIISWTINKKIDSGSIKIINRDGSIDYRNKNDSLIDINEVSKVKLFERLKEEKNKLFIIDQSGNNWSKVEKKWVL